MARKSRAPNKRRDAGGPPVVAKVSGPGDVAVMIPYLMGFRPEESLVVVALEGPKRRFGPVLRVDLVDDASLRDAQAERVVDVLALNGVRRVLVAAYSEQPDRADPVVRRVMGCVLERGIALEDAFRADGRRWWSYTCDDPSCCSPDGMTYDAGTSRVAAEAVVSGLAFAPDRESLRALFAPDAPEVRDEVAAISARRPPLGPQRAAATVIPARVAAVLSAPESMTPDVVVALAAAVQTRAGQEVAMGLVAGGNPAAHFELWRIVTRRVPDSLLPAAASLAAFSAWLDGRGVLASHAVDRVLEVAPEYPLAVTIGGLLDAAVNPRTWLERAGRTGPPHPGPPLS